MVHLITVMGSFHARVLEARLAAEGVTAALRGIDEGLYPLGFPVDVLVAREDLDVAREILLADAVDAAFDPDPVGAASTAAPARRRTTRWRLRRSRGR